MGEHSLPELEDTQPLDIHDLPTTFWEADEIVQATTCWPTAPAWSKAPPVILPRVVRVRTPEPALIRGIIMAVGGLTLLVAFRDLDHKQAEPWFRLYIGAGPILLAWWIRRNVTPARKTEQEEL